MRWLPLLIVLASLRADARPARLDDDYYKPEPPCPRIASWAKFARCKLKDTKFELVHDLPAAKLVSYELSYARGTKRLELYVLASGAWMKSQFYAEVITTSSELLGFQSLAGNAYRIDLGFATSTSVTLDEVTTRPALLRRQYTYVCTTSSCRTVQTACDVLVHGKAVASYRLVPSWNGNELKLTGIAQNTNRYCPAPPGLQAPEEAP